MDKVSREQAELEVRNWALDVKKIRKKVFEKEEVQEYVEELIEGVMEGVFVIDDEGCIVQKLAVPLDDSGNYSELKYKPRFKLKQMQNVKGSDNEKTIALIAALTGLNKGLISNLETNDFATSSPLTALYMAG